MSEVSSLTIHRSPLLRKDKRDSRADSPIVQENGSKLLGIVNSLIRDTAESQDIVQDTFVEMLQANDVNAVIETASAWLVTVAKNKVLDRFRRKKTQSTNAGSVREVEQERLIASEFDPESQAWSAELREKLIAAIQTLPPEQKSVFIQHELEGQSFEEISAATGVGLNTLLSRKRYAIQTLRESLQEVYNELD